MNRICIAALAVALFGCENVDIGNDDGITRSDVEAITPGSGDGVVFSGTWVLDYTVSNSNCEALAAALPDGFPEQPPVDGDADSEEIVLAQNDGELTRFIDDFGDNYLFRGRVESDGDFEYGIYFEALGVEKIEITTGRMNLAESGEATLTGTSTRRYRLPTLSLACEATLRIEGTRTLAGEGGS